MNVAIIGAGKVGRALAGSITRAGHSVVISSKKAEDAQRAAAEVGARAARSNREAVEGAEVIILAVPFDAVEGIVDEVGSGMEGKVVVDLTNRFEAAEIDGTSNAEKTQAQAPRARVVKAFNTVFAGRQADPRVDGVPLDGFVAGDDEEAKAKVLELAGSIGLRPIDAGPLTMARALEAMAVLNISLNMRNGWPWLSGWKLLGPTGD